MKVYLVKDKLTNDYYKIDKTTLIPATSRKAAIKKVVKRFNVKAAQLAVFYMCKL